MFDISRLDVKTGSDAGAVMNIVDPRTSQLALNEKGDPITITMLGINAEKVKRFQRQRLDANLAASAQRGFIRTNTSSDEVDKESVDLLVACTLDWSFTEMDGKPFPYSEENARIFWSDARFATVKLQAANFINTPGNFMKG